MYRFIYVEHTVEIEGENKKRPEASRINNTWRRLQWKTSVSDDSHLSGFGDWVYLGTGHWE